MNDSKINIKAIRDKNKSGKKGPVTKPKGKRKNKYFGIKLFL